MGIHTYLRLPQVSLRAPRLPLYALPLRGSLAGVRSWKGLHIHAIGTPYYHATVGSSIAGVGFQVRQRVLTRSDRTPL